MLKLSTFVVVIAAIAAGCLAPIAQHDRPATVGATYARGSNTLHVELVGPVDMQTASGAIFNASSLLFSYGEGPVSRILHVDGAFRLIRSDDECAEQSEGACVRRSLDWTGEGLPTFIGIGLPDLYHESGEYRWTQASISSQVEVRRTEAGGTVRIEVHVPDEIADPATVQGSMFFEFQAGDPWPIRFGPAGDGMAWERRATETRPQMWATELLPASSLGLRSHLVGEWGDLGSDWGVSAMEIDDHLAGARAQLPEFDEALASSCLRGVRVITNWTTNEPLLAPDLIATHRYLIGEPADLQWWQISYYRDRITNDRDYHVDGKLAESSSFTCEDLGKQPGPCGGASAWLEGVARLGLTGLDAEATVKYWDHPLLGDGMNGTLLYRWSGTAPWGAANGLPMPVRVDFMASQGRLHYASLAISDGVPTFPTCRS